MDDGTGWPTQTPRLIRHSYDKSESEGGSGHDIPVDERVPWTDGPFDRSAKNAHLINMVQDQER